MRNITLLICIAAYSISTFASSNDDQIRKADEALNSTYQNVISQAPDHQKNLLRNAQRAWIAFRDSACTFESSLKNPSQDWISQETHPAQDGFCIQRLTLERLAHLQRYSDFLQRANAPSLSGASERTRGCNIGNLPANFTVQAVGVYEGEINTDVQLDSSGHATKAVEIIVNRPNENVVVVLMAYDPVLWKIKHTPSSRIAGVIVGGYHNQAVIGIEQSVPLLISTHTGRKECGQYFYAYKAGSDLLKANTIIKGITGREIDQLWSNHKGARVHIGTSPSEKAELIYSNDLKPEDYTNLPTIPSGQKGIEHLINVGLLRRTLPMDVDEWIKMASAPYRKFNQKIKVDRPEDGYVVLGKMTYPTGLFGAHSVAFFIPPGIPLPDGNPGHSSIYFIEDGSCRGPSCSGR